ncbi:MFS transporter [Caloranaerobacter sp. DY30410]|uniref:MFS transporter n=1 Tax=Caloranaerobacter sp. DY30410 TaxID=3238305 RepID=UPI003CFEA162
MMNLENYKKATILYGFISSLYNMADKLYGIVFILLMYSKKLSSHNISIVFAISSLSLAIFDYPSGNVSDKYGRKKTTGIGFLLWGIGMIAYGNSTKTFGFILSSIIMAFGLALISGALQSWYVDYLQKSNKLDYKDKIIPKLVGITSIFAAVGSIIGTVLIKKNLNLPVIVAGGIAFIAGLVTLSFLEDNYGEITNDSIWVDIINNTKSFARDKSMKKILMRSLFAHTAFICFILSWQIYGVNKVGLDPSLNGILLIIFMLLFSLSGFITSKLIDYFKAIHISIIGMLVAALGLIIIFIKPNIWFFIIGLCVFEFGLGMDLSSTNTWIHDYIPNNKRATFYSGLSAIKSFYGFFITIVIGYFIDYFGYSYTWLLAAIAQTCAAIYLIVNINNLVPAIHNNDMNRLKEHI